MTRVQIDCRRIKDESSLHDVFKETLGFSDFYGRNMDAWNDCMGDLDDPDTGMTKIHAPPGGIVVLELDHSRISAADALNSIGLWLNARRSSTMRSWKWVNLRCSRSHSSWEIRRRHEFGHTLRTTELNVLMCVSASCRWSWPVRSKRCGAD